jgi:hypothetical protein
MTGSMLNNLDPPQLWSFSDAYLAGLKGSVVLKAYIYFSLFCAAV